VYIACSNANVLQGDRIEHPQYIRDNHTHVKVDSEYYITHQLMKPVSQLMALVVDEVDRAKRPNTYKRLPSEWTMELTRLKRLFPDNPAKVDEHYDRVREKFTEHYLFDQILTKLQNIKNKQRTMGEFFPRVRL
jgi:hypothetical protein